MLEFTWEPSRKVPTTQGDSWEAENGVGYGLDMKCHFPPLAYKDRFHGFWCWFDPANALDDNFQVCLRADADLPALKRKIWWAGMDMIHIEKTSGNRHCSTVTGKFCETTVAVRLRAAQNHGCYWFSPHGLRCTAKNA